MKYRTVEEIKAAVVAAQREGVIKKETLDWFRYEYKDKMERALKRQHQDGTLEQTECLT